MTWLSVWSVLKKVPGWVWLALAGLVVGFAYVEAEKARARREEQAKQTKRENEQREILVETVNQIQQETEDAKDRAIDAPNHVDDVASADELRERYPDNARVILRTRETGGSDGSR